MLHFPDALRVQADGHVVAYHRQVVVVFDMGHDDLCAELLRKGHGRFEGPSGNLREIRGQQDGVDLHHGYTSISKLRVLDTAGVFLAYRDPTTHKGMPGSRKDSRSIARGVAC